MKSVLLGDSPGVESGLGARLAPLLSPRSIAFVGASAREGTPGHTMLDLNRRGALEGRLYPVNPRYSRIDGVECYPSLGELPEVPDLVVLGLADQRLESALSEAASVGARAALIFGGANLEEPEQTRLVRRLTAMAEEANLPICGGNCMGFYNLDAGLRLTFSRPPSATAGGQRRAHQPLRLVVVVAHPQRRASRVQSLGLLRAGAQRRGGGLHALRVIHAYHPCDRTGSGDGAPARGFPGRALGGQRVRGAGHGAQSGPNRTERPARDQPLGRNRG